MIFNKKEKLIFFCYKKKEKDILELLQSYMI